ARESEPFIEQVFIGRGPGQDELTLEQWERKLYIIRKRCYHASSKMQLQRYYAATFSARTICYKGLLLAPQIFNYYPDLQDPDFLSAIALVHQRFSTNTFPTWERAQPFRYLAHNGEINTVRGNVNWMRAREATLHSELFGHDIDKLKPIIDVNGSDSTMIDNALELLVQSGRSVAHSLMMLVPEAWSSHKHMSDAKKAFYEFHATMMEPWDGPASLVFSDGRFVGGNLDRNGLRPSRYWVTHDDLVVLASEAGVLPEIEPANVKVKGRLQPGRMFLVDTEEGRIIADEEIKEKIAGQRPYRKWLDKELIDLDILPEAEPIEVEHDSLLRRQRAFGYTLEDERILLGPMAEKGQEPIGSMGVDVPLACLSDQPQLLFNYFKQLFAQVTNPAIDPIREELVMSTVTYIGPEGNLLSEGQEFAHVLKVRNPILSNHSLAKLRSIGDPSHRIVGAPIVRFGCTTLDMTFPAAEGPAALEPALAELCEKAERAADDGYAAIILSDRGVDKDRAAIPSLLALAAVHHHLIRSGRRGKVGLIVETAEAREVMHFCLLLGYGASAINPYLAYGVIADLVQQDRLRPGLEIDEAIENYRKAIKKGILKVMSKMGISTVQSYQGAQIFEAVGLNRSVVERYFEGTTSQIEGVGLEVIAQEALARHASGYKPITEAETELEVGGKYQFRVRGERHLLNPHSVSKLQHAVQRQSFSTYKEYADTVNDMNKNLCTLRGLFEFHLADDPVPIEEVEPAKEIVKRFCTGAMSFGSISKEAHETLAIAMNRLGGRSNTGEGGEDPERFKPLPNGDSKRSAIKQVASGRFGVTANYLVNADELQIKISQGAKPGEGGQLPGHKVDEFIAKIRHSTPGVGLISPPPHHDIYSIEDLAQLIWDLKEVNPRCRVSVKLVAQPGIGTIACGVVKAGADVVLVSGGDGGTGASPLGSLKHTGFPWEL
ncbi:MAG: glutamate synthase large subunit, partial [Acidobacteria bacterium]|nr:glutamate synthase large subunit [Acidobacteriota bacterium]